MLAMLRVSCLAIMGSLTASTIGLADSPVVAVGSENLDSTLKALLSDKVETSILQRAAGKCEAETATQWLGTVLSARLTILERCNADPMIVERLQHQGATIEIIEHSADQESSVGMLKRLRAVYRVLVQRFPEHESELKHSLDTEIRKHRCRGALNMPSQTYLAGAMNIRATQELIDQ